MKEVLEGNLDADEAATNIEASDSVDMRFSAKYQRRSDWIDNVENGTGNDFGGFDEYAYRLQVLIDPNDMFTALLKFHGFHQDGSQPQISNTELPIMRSPPSVSSTSGWNWKP